MSERPIRAPFDLVEVKSASDGWEFTGHVAAFENIDLVDDVIHKGAFDNTLRAREFRPLLWSHDSSQLPVGVEKSLRPDGRGLLGTWELLDTQLGSDVYKALKKNAVRSMSVGYRVPDGGAKFDNGGIRHLHEVELLECSLVNMPANPLAMITGVKSLDDLPFADRWQAIGEYLKYGVGEAEALQARRVADNRSLGPQHIEALRKSLPLVEAYGHSLRTLIDAAAEVEAERGSEPRSGWGDPRIELRRRRLRHAGILEPIRS